MGTMALTQATAEMQLPMANAIMTQMGTSITANAGMKVPKMANSDFNAASQRDSLFNVKCR